MNEQAERAARDAVRAGSRDPETLKLAGILEAPPDGVDPPHLAIIADGSRVYYDRRRGVFFAR